jgi:transcriptional regulator with XRE-family HTH domain
MTYGKMLREFRKEAELTISNLADVIRLSTDYVGKVEREVIPPLNVRLTRKICRYLGRDPTPLLKEIAKHRLSDFPAGTELTIPPEEESSKAPPTTYTVQPSYFVVKLSLEEDKRPAHGPELVFHTDSAHTAKLMYQAVGNWLRTMNGLLKK